MDTLLVAALSVIGFIVAYHTYGRWLGRRIFKLDDANPVPSQALRDDSDYCPTRKDVVFGHHFTSIAGTGPIVGPAIAVFWGWLPAVIWVVLGSIFIGAVHDFGALVVSVRNEGQSLGNVAGSLIGKRARVLFLVAVVFCLTIVLGVFGLVIAVIFAFYPEAVLSVWIEIPLALGIGYWAYKKNGKLLIPSLIALAVMYGAIWVGTHLPITVGNLPLMGSFPNAVTVWTLILFVYCFVASVLPVWLLMQPRDYINSHELQLALVLVGLGLIVAGLTGSAQLMVSAPAIATAPTDAPPMFPFLFITIACGAVSGFHCLVSSGTSSKQISRESHAQAIGYGAMLLEAVLAILVIMACTAGVGMGRFTRETGADGKAYAYVAAVTDAGEPVTGRAAWTMRYGTSWNKFDSLASKVGAFIEGSANFLTKLGLPLKLAIGIMAVLVASFAATTLDTATRLQRYVIQELARTLDVRPLKNKYAATTLAVALGLGMALIPGPGGVGSGGLILWPIFGATNQILACLAFLVIGVYLRRRNAPTWFLVVPFLIMLILPSWAMLLKMQSWWQAWQGGKGGANLLLFVTGAAMQTLVIWLVVEAALVWNRVRGVDLAPPPPPTYG